jgi:hypothetical protein
MPNSLRQAAIALYFYGMFLQALQLDDWQGIWGRYMQWNSMMTQVLLPVDLLIPL